MNPMKILKTTAKVGCISVGALFVVYQFNLDMKLVGWLYHVLNAFHAHKPKDFEF